MWARCAQGHSHWGRHGAAGLLIRHTDAVGTMRYLLQHRARGVHHGDTWGIPGGAVEPGESVELAAWREVREELGLERRDDLAVAGIHVDDHGGWSYSTVVLDSPDSFAVAGINFETGPGGCRWLTAEQVEAEHLHPGFAKSWPALASF